MESVQGHDGASLEPLIGVIGHGVVEIEFFRCRPNPLPRLAQGGSRGYLGVHKPKNGPCGAGRMFTESVQGHDGASFEPLIGVIGHGVVEIEIFRCRPNPLPRLAQGGVPGVVGGP